MDANDSLTSDSSLLQEQAESDLITNDNEYFAYTVALCGITIIAIEVVFCLVCTLLRVDKLKDVAGGCAFIVIAVLSLLLNAQHQLRPFHWRQILVTSCVCVWAFRLAAYLLFRHICMGQDKHTVGQPPTCCKHLGYWTFQAVWVFVVSLPVMAVNSSSQHYAYMMWSPMDIAGTVIFGVGATFELIADQQKLNYKRNPLNYSKWCTFGFWKWCRHPNYLFEMITWWGIFLLSVQTASTGPQLLGVFSPLFVMFILLFVSGIPVVEAAADFKYGKFAEYRRYKRHTSVLIPMHPWIYKRFPESIKRTIFLDFPIYNFLAEEKECDSDIMEPIPF